MLRLFCDGDLIEKTRHRVRHGDHVWEIDEFAGSNLGLTVAEVELGTEDEIIDLPAWVGEEVTDDPRYYNIKLVETPYSEW
jgi:adenylate cyclase